MSIYDGEMFKSNVDDDKNVVTVDVDCNMDPAFNKVDALAARLDELQEKYADLIAAGTPIVYNYYGCSFNYGENSYAEAYYGGEEAY